MRLILIRHFSKSEDVSPNSWLDWQHRYSQSLRKITKYCLILVQQQEDTPETLFSIKIKGKRN